MVASRAHLRRASLALASLAYVGAASGCDKLFSLAHVPAWSPDARADDAGATDTPAACIAKTQHDEDSDNLKDDCDACPTITSDLLDGDGDGLTDACDPDLSNSVDGDRIVFVALFASSAELATLFDTSGTGAAASISADRLVLPAGAQAAVKTTSVPTQMAIEVASVTGSDLADGLMLAQNGASCSVTAAGCGGEIGSICVSFGSNVTRSFPISAVKGVRIFQTEALLHCEIDLGTATFTSDTPGTFTNSIPFVRALGNGQASIDNFVIYGEK